MKTLKCPLCGNEMQLRSDEVCSGYYVQLYYYECIGCPLATTPVDTTKEAENQIKDLISRFPPIMRLGQGDNVMVRFSDDTHTVLYTNVDRGKIYLQDVYGNALPYDVDEIKQWPWELEQKGGSNDI